MTREDILRMAHEARFYVKNDEAYSPSNQADHELTEHLERFAKLVTEHERNFCIQFLMELHGAQMGNNNLYQYAAQALTELDEQKLPDKFSLTIKEFKCTGCKGKWHDAEDAKHHSCKDYQ